MESPQEFQCTLSTFNKISTTILSLFPLIFLLFAIINNQSLLIVLAVGLAIFMGFFTFFAPRKYVIDDEKVSIIRWGSNIDIPFNKMKKVSQVTLPRAIRTFGVGGYFGNYGWYYDKNVGPYLAYNSRYIGPLIMFEFDSIKPIVISPDHVENFISTLKEHIPDKVTTE